MQAWGTGAAMAAAMVMSLGGATGCGRRTPDASQVHSDSGVRLPYDADEVAARSVAEVPLRWRGYATDHVYGRSGLGKALHVVRIADPAFIARAGEPRPAALATQAIHGNEFLDIANHLPSAFFGVEPSRLIRHAEDLSDLAGLETEPRPAFARFLAAGGVFYLVSIVNPDGYAANERGSAEGDDLNRDFDIHHYGDDPEIPRTIHSSENRAFAAMLDARFLPKTPAGWSLPHEDGSVDDWAKLEAPATDAREDLKLSFDYHCCQAEDSGSLMLPWGDTPSLAQPLGIPARDVATYRAYGDIYLRDFAGDFFGTGLEAIGYIAKGTGDEYAYERFADASLTYEGLSADGEPERLPLHVAFWDDALRKITP